MHASVQADVEFKRGKFGMTDSYGTRLIHICGMAQFIHETCLIRLNDIHECAQTHSHEYYPSTRGSRGKWSSPAAST